jgi:iron complex transport system ATP-binding protein
VEPLPHRPDEIPAPPDPDHFLELANVNVARGDRIVLHDVHLSIRAGEHVAILGPNGCGKSTLILTITCQIYPIVQPGMHVRIFGRDRWDLTQLRQHFGVVGTDLPGERTAVTTGLDAVIAGFFSASTLWPNLHVTAEMRARAAEALARMEASHLAARLVGEMSAGEKRRILIARALVHRPRQLLLDEPSNALDLAAQRELRETLRHRPVTLGKSGLKVTRLAFGTGSNNGHVQSSLGQKEFTRLIHYAYDRGIRFFETAESYSTPAMLGEALKGLPRARATS